MEEAARAAEASSRGDPGGLLGMLTTGVSVVVVLVAGDCDDSGCGCDSSWASREATGAEPTLALMLACGSEVGGLA